MQLFRWSRGWAAGVLLLCGCRSEQVAFQLIPVRPPKLVPAPPTPLTPAKPAPLPQPAPATPRASTAAIHSAPTQKPWPEAAHVVARPARSVGKLLWQAARKRPETTARRTPRQPIKRDKLHLVLGGLLVAAGVVAGLVLGGWLGLGVGALIVILGYYFLVLGMGGQHAWLEIFQEFFNM